MKKPLPTALAVIVLSAILAAQAPVDQSKLAQQLRTGTDDQREAAARAVLSIPPTARQPSILLALTQELDRLKQELETRRLALPRGESLSPMGGEGEYLFALCDAVSQHDDPVVLRPLMYFINTGNRVIDKIAAFGELALPEVLTLASSDSAPGRRGDTAAAILTLQRMLERPVRNPLSAKSRQQILDLAAKRLSGKQKDYVITAALDLAVATGDPSLIRRVQVIAASASDVQRMGVAETRILDVQKWANRALAAHGIR
jgi:hypothetical protein